MKIASNIAIFFIKVYQVSLSPFFLIGAKCNFRPTCSEYMIEAIRVHGLFRGVYLGMKRISKCTPNRDFTFDPVPPKKEKYKIIAFLFCSFLLAGFTPNIAAKKIPSKDDFDIYIPKGFCASAKKIQESDGSDDKVFFLSYIKCDEMDAVNPSAILTIFVSQNEATLNQNITERYFAELNAEEYDRYLKGEMKKPREIGLVLKNQMPKKETEIIKIVNNDFIIHKITKNKNYIRNFMRSRLFLNGVVFYFDMYFDSYSDMGQRDFYDILKKNKERNNYRKNINVFDTVIPFPKFYEFSKYNYVEDKNATTISLKFDKLIDSSIVEREGFVTVTVLKNNSKNSIVLENIVNCKDESCKNRKYLDYRGISFIKNKVSYGTCFLNTLYLDDENSVLIYYCEKNNDSVYQREILKNLYKYRQSIIKANGF